MTVYFHTDAHSFKNLHCALTTNKEIKIVKFSQVRKLFINFLKVVFKSVSTYTVLYSLLLLINSFTETYS